MLTKETLTVGMELEQQTEDHRKYIVREIREKTFTMENVNNQKVVTEGYDWLHMYTQVIHAE